MSDFDDLISDMDEVIMDEFGDQVSVVGSDITFSAVFDSPTDRVALSKNLRGKAGFHLNLEYPLLSVRDTDAVNLSDDMLLLVRGQQYRIVNMLPDGHGLVEIELDKPVAGYVGVGERWQ